MKYFGTDGIRGIYGEGITEDVAYRTGRAVAALFGGKGVVCRDTRLSGPSLEDALVSGLTAGGADVLLGGVLPTPAAAFLTERAGAAFGIVVSASHNPPEYNGIKIFLPTGKLPTSAEEAIEYLMENVPSAMQAKGKRAVFEGGREAYVEQLAAEADEMGAALGGSGRADGLRVLLDAGNGAAAGVAREVFTRLGASVGELCDGCKGECINVRCGALHPSRMAEEAEAGHYDLGLSFDGDADRLVVWRRRLLDGDEVMFNLARTLPPASKVVGTVMTNGALERALAERGIGFVRTAVGDRNIGELMRLCGAGLGGEPSGHFILGRHITGDGLLSGIAVSLLTAVRGGLDELELDRSRLTSVPASPAVLLSDGFRKAVEEAKRMADRVVVRMSGTEPCLRILAEGGNAEGAVERIVQAVR